MLECVEAAVKKVIEMGHVDPRRIGINGHSYGGEGAAFIGTRSRLFAANTSSERAGETASHFHPGFGR